MASCTIETRFASARSICKATCIAVLTVAALVAVFTKVALGALLLTPDTKKEKAIVRFVLIS